MSVQFARLGPALTRPPGSRALLRPDRSGSLAYGSGPTGARRISHVGNTAQSPRVGPNEVITLGPVQLITLTRHPRREETP